MSLLRSAIFCSIASCLWMYEVHGYSSVRPSAPPASMEAIFDQFEISERQLEEICAEYRNNLIRSYMDMSAAQPIREGKLRGLLREARNAHLRILKERSRHGSGDVLMMSRSQLESILAQIEEEFLKEYLAAIRTSSANASRSEQRESLWALLRRLFE